MAGLTRIGAPATVANSIAAERASAFVASMVVLLGLLGIVQHRQYPAAPNDAMIRYVGIPRFAEREGAVEGKGSPGAARAGFDYEHEHRRRATEHEEPSGTLKIGRAHV